MAKTEDAPQSSNKAGLKSLGKKLDSSRHGFETHPAARRPAGAFGAERGLGTAAVRRRKAGTTTPKAGKASALRRVK